MSLGLVCNICWRTMTMKQRRYTPDEKSEIMLTFIERRKTEGISLRCYAGEIGIPYYTMRDMYRDPRYNPEWDRRYEICSPAFLVAIHQNMNRTALKCCGSV